MAKQLKHSHQIHVETDEENVTVMIGGDGGVPGGFAKLFNRIVDSGAWGRLSDAARAAYIPLVRFADHRNQFRVQIGQAALMKYSGLSRSSIKRAMKDLLTSRLLALVEQGGVNSEGQNESNVYQLMVPTEGKPRIVAGGIMGALHGAKSASLGEGAQNSKGAGNASVLGKTGTAKPASGPAGPSGGSTPSSHEAPQGVRQRTPSPSMGGPPPGSSANRRAGRPPAAPGGHCDAPGGSASGPQYRESDKELNIKTMTRPGRAAELLAEDDGDPDDGVPSAAALLVEKGVEAGVARQLAGDFPHERIVDVIATMEYRKARGKCDNPGGFIREALLKQWQTPRAVVEARRRAEARLRQQAADETARQARGAEQATASAEEQRIEQLVAAMDDDELTILAESVLEKYAGNTAVLQVLTRKPPRACRLMKMEIARMLAVK